MRTTPFTLALIALLLTGLASGSAQEHKVQRSDLPAAVVATLDREAGGAEIKGYTSEREGGKRVYEAETMLNGHTRDLQVAEDGHLMEIEEEVPFNSLSTAVQAGLNSRAAGAAITKVESLTKQGKLVAYEASTLRGKKKGEIQVGPKGERLARPE